MYSRFLFLSLFLLSLNALSYLDSNQMYTGVTELAFGGTWSPVSFDDPTKAFSLLTSNKTPYIAVSEAGLGRAVAFGKENVFDPTEITRVNNGRFVANIFQWAAKGKTQLRVLSYKNALSTKFRDAINAVGVINITLTQTNVLPSNFTGVDLFVIGHFSSYPSEVNDSQIAQVVNYVKNGGNILSAGIAWVWYSYGEGQNSSKNIMTDFFNNRIMGPLGLYHVDGPTGISAIHNITALNPPADERTVMAALVLLADRMLKNSSLTALEENLINTALALIQSNQWISFQNFFPSTLSYEALLKFYSNSIFLPNPKSQIPISNTTASLIYSVLIALDSRIPRDQPRPPFPDAKFWPGMTNSTERTTVTVRIPVGRTKFICTGVFENAGEVITVTVHDPQNLKYKMEVLIGTGDDLTWKAVNNKRDRFPLVRYSYKLTAQTTKVATPHGGMVYLFVDKPTNDSNVLVSIGGGVAAPYFNSELHTDLDWIKSRNLSPAPFMNLECKGLIWIYPVTPFIKTTLQNVTELCRWWDRVYSNYPYLSGDVRSYKEVIMGDIDIGAGYMHSGMPVMTFLDVVDFSLGKNNELFQKCSWGHFHELGHNYQRGDWTFEGTGEVTNNIWSLYGGYTMCGFQPMTNPWFGKRVNQTVMTYFSQGSNYTQWKSDPGLALVMYAQIAQEFGFDTFKKVFAEYLTLNNTQRPQNDDQKRDQWMVRLSKTLGRNLGPFFNRWGVPTSVEAQNSVANLTQWVPKEFAYWLT